jgi:hypothetical protein
VSGHVGKVGTYSSVRLVFKLYGFSRRLLVTSRSCSVGGIGCIDGFATRPALKRLSWRASMRFACACAGNWVRRRTTSVC